MRVSGVRLGVRVEDVWFRVSGGDGYDVAPHSAGDHLLYFCLIRGRDTRQEDVESLSTLRLEGSPTQSRISPSIQRMLRYKKRRC